MNTRTSNILIIGGGILGTALAYYLGRRGTRNVTLLEKGEPGDGSTGKSAAIVRMHYTNPATVQLALRSRELFLNWTDAVDPQPVYNATGWYFLVPPDQESNLRSNLAMNIEVGVDAELRDVEQVAREIDGINADGIGLAVFEAKSGCADPSATCRGLVRHAQGHGVEVITGAPVDRILTAGDRVVGAESGGTRYTADVTVLAAGPWSGKLAAGIGLILPLEVTREQELVLRPGDASHAPPFAISNMCDQIYQRPMNGNLLVGRGYPKDYEPVDVDSHKASHDDAFVDDVLPRLTHRFPRLAGTEVERGVVGLYTVTPDWHPIVGPVRSRPGLWAATGGSGHSFKIGPALGEMLADLIIEGRSDWIDASLFDCHRFEDGKTFSSTYGGNRA
jgi:glycine/D-amino acid oxidase-like deaminating enzyme